MSEEKLALFGGTPTVTGDHEPLFHWPIITSEDEEAALSVIRQNKYSGTDITEKFQEEFAAWQGRKYALAFTNGTMALTSAMYALGLSKGDEIICPTKTYWGTISQTLELGLVPVLCNITENLSIDPNDIERCISPYTKAIMVVHYFAYPADMDPIMKIAKKHHLYVIEDCSHAQGGLYKGRKVGTFGDVAAMSLMSGKSFAAGELGILVTDSRNIYEHSIAFAHYERNNENYITDSPDLKPYHHIALGGVKGRANQVCSALARVQLKYYDERCAEIRRAMNRFWDCLEGVPGIRPIRVDEKEGSNMAGWYCPHGSYHPEELGGLPVDRFCEAVRAEIGGICWPGGNFCLHTHPYFNTFDFFHEGIPTRLANAHRDVRPLDALCKPSENMLCFSAPWFKHDETETIELYAAAYRKVAEHWQELLPENAGQGGQGGRWYGTSN